MTQVEAVEVPDGHGRSARAGVEGAEPDDDFHDQRLMMGQDIPQIRGRGSQTDKDQGKAKDKHQGVNNGNPTDVDSLRIHG